MKVISIQSTGQSIGAWPFQLKSKSVTPKYKQKFPYELKSNERIIGEELVNMATTVG